MRNILNLIQRYYVFLLFLTLQVFALYVFFNNNNYAKAEFVNHSRDWVGSIYSQRTQLKEYLMLGEINDRLSLENAILRRQLPEIRSPFSATYIGMLKWKILLSTVNAIISCWIVAPWAAWNQRWE
jgi:rod shape-determining protein MreC